jgi:hypothetical protein
MSGASAGFSCVWSRYARLYCGIILRFWKMFAPDDESAFA